MSSKAERVVVMGGSSGIGESTARLFVQRGAEVIITGRDREKLQGAQARTGAAQARSVDATSAEAVSEFFEAVGPLDHLVLSLSSARGMGPFRQLPLAEIRAAFEGKFWPQLQSLAAALPRLRETGSVTFITAASARCDLPGTAGLAALNGALEAMVGPLAAELAPIRVNAISPGVVETPWWNAFPKEAREQVMRDYAAKLPVKRVGHPDDVAAAIVMVATNGFMTGTVIGVDGGGALARG